MQAITGKSANGEVDFSLAYQYAVVHVADEWTGEHQSRLLRRSRIADNTGVSQFGLFDGPHVHFMRNALAHAGKWWAARGLCPHWHRLCPGRRRSGTGTMAAHRRSATPQPPKLPAFLDEAGTDVLASMSFPAAHNSKLHSTNPLERSTARSSGGPMWSASSPMRAPSPV